MSPQNTKGGNDLWSCTNGTNIMHLVSHIFRLTSNAYLHNTNDRIVFWNTFRGNAA